MYRFSFLVTLLPLWEGKEYQPPTLPSSLFQGEEPLRRQVKGLIPIFGVKKVNNSNDRLKP